VKTAKLASCGLDGTLHVGLARHVGANEPHTVAVLRSFRGAGLFVHIDDDRAATGGDDGIGGCSA
jgi:hypothetical protein